MVPANFLDVLSAVAFVNGEEAAWQQKDCLAAIDWLSKNGCAVRFELWLPEDGGIRRATSTKAGPAIYVSSCQPVEEGAGEHYVQRREAAGHIGGFHWPDFVRTIAACIL